MKHTFFYVLIRSRNSGIHLEQCIYSVLTQAYHDYKILFVDDCSQYSKDRKRQIQRILKNHICIFNPKRQFSVYNGYYMIHKYAVIPNSIVVNLDGDDYLSNPNVFNTLHEIYQYKKCLITYGNCYLERKGVVSSKPANELMNYTNVEYPPDIVKNKLFRTYPFLPLHLRTWSVSLFKKIQTKDLQNHKKEWLRYCEDLAYYFPMLEMAYSKTIVISEPLSVYRMNTQSSDINNVTELIKDELVIRKKKSYETIY